MNTQAGFSRIEKMTLQGKLSAVLAEIDNLTHLLTLKEDDIGGSEELSLMKEDIYTAFSMLSDVRDKIQKDDA